MFTTIEKKLQDTVQQILTFSSQERLFLISPLSLLIFGSRKQKTGGGVIRALGRGQEGCGASS
jgi:hypothetical protein